MIEQEKLAFELEIRKKVAEENRAKQREAKARWREKNREYLRNCERARRARTKASSPNHKIVQYTADNVLVRIYNSADEAANELGVTPRTIRNWCAGHNGIKNDFRWKYLKEETSKMRFFENWKEVTKGLYRYVIGANVCYELHILHWDFDTDILTAKASVYLAGDWTQSDGNSFFEREPILMNHPVFECLEAAEKDNAENNQ